MLTGKEKLEAQIKKGNEKLVCDALGFIDYEHYKRFKHNAIYGLGLFGDRFSQGLAIALNEACDKNSMKIITTWRNEVTQAEMLYKMHLAKEAAK